MNAIQRILTVRVLLAALASGQGQPIITNQPLSITNLAGTTATFSVGAEGTPPLAYQWWSSGSGIPYPLSGDTGATLTIANVQSGNAGGYSAVITNLEGAVTSVVATLTELTPPRIVLQPTNQTASLFADTTFRASAVGDAPLRYQWRFDNTNLPAMTTATLTVTNVQRADVGAYDLVVTNSSGSVTSRVATLTIVPFNSIYCFGFSWTGTSGLNPLGNSCGWNFPQYYQNRASNGPLWPEYLSTNLGLAYVAANNYAQCGARALDVLNQTLSFVLPHKPELSLYYLWAGDADFFRTLPGSSDYVSATNQTAWNQIIQAMVLESSNAVAHLYARGARTIVVSAGESPYDALTRMPWPLTTEEAALEESYELRFHAEFYDAVRSFAQGHPDARLLSVPVFSKMDDIVANPSRYGVTETQIDALDDPSLADKSFTGPGANYMYWDGAHPTTKVHKQIAAWHLQTLTNSVLEEVRVGVLAGSPVIQMNHLQIGRDYTLQSSADLAQWNDIQSFTAGAGTNQWRGGAGAASAGFYRLKWQP